MEYKVKKKGRPYAVNTAYEDINNLKKKEFIAVSVKDWQLKTPPNGFRLKARLGKKYKVETIDDFGFIGWKITRL